MHSFFKAILKTGSGSLASIAFGVLGMKIMATMLGPAGVGLFSLVRQTIVTLSVVGNSSQTALVQGISGKSGNERASYIRTTAVLILVATAGCILLVLIFAGPVSQLVFGNVDSASVTLIRWMSVPVVLSNIYFYLKSMLNGFRAIGTLAVVEVLGPAVSLLLTYSVCLYAGNGHAVAFVALLSSAQLVMILATLRLLCTRGWVTGLMTGVEQWINREALLYFVKITGSTFIAGLVSTAALLVLRSSLTRYGGLQEAGLFDLAWTLSSNYGMILLGSFGTYYVPTLSGLTDSGQRRELILNCLNVAIRVAVPLIVAIVVLKPLIITILYTKEFLPATKLIRWMLIGDYLKVTAWVLTIPAVVSVHMRVYLVGEIFWYLGFAALSAGSILYLGRVDGVGVIFGLLYACLCGYYYVYLSRVHRLKIPRRTIGSWLGGFLIVVAASTQQWEVSVVQPAAVAAWILAALVFVWLTLESSERKTLTKMIFRKGV